MSDNKIAYIVSRFPVLTETFITGEIQELRRKGIQVYVFSLKGLKRDDALHLNTEELIKTTHYYNYLFSLEIWSAFLSYLRTRPVTCYHILWKIFKTHIRNPVLLLKTLASTPKAFAIAGSLHELGIKRVHAHWATIPTTVAWIVSKLNEIDFTFTAHAWDLFKSDTMLEDKISEARKVITCTNFNKEYLEGKFAGINSDKIVAIYHGMDLKKFRPGKKKRNHIFTILSIGRLTEKKGFHVLLKACSMLRKKQIRFICQIVYVRGNFEREIFQLYHSLDLKDYVQFVPGMTQEELINYYGNADCFVLPCIVTDSGDRDGIPNVILEALAMELPIVTTPISGIPEVIKNGETGLLVNPNSAEELAVAIEKLYADEKLRKELGKAGRDFVNQHFEISSNVERVLTTIFS